MILFAHSFFQSPTRSGSGGAWKGLVAPALLCSGRREREGCPFDSGASRRLGGKPFFSPPNFFFFETH
jgi:hypothetical protein